MSKKYENGKYLNYTTPEQLKEMFSKAKDTHQLKEMFSEEANKILNESYVSYLQNNAPDLDEASAEVMAALTPKEEKIKIFIQQEENDIGNFKEKY